jgi:hypothetical protein
LGRIHTNFSLLLVVMANSMMIKPTTHSDPDKALPHSDTCFFNLALPAYTNEENMKKKILYAISATMTMNADDEVEDIHGTRQPRGGR